jgi:hypothetical protein
MIELTSDGKCRGPGGPDPKKSRSVREQELHTLARTAAGLEIIDCLWHEAKGIGPGVDPPDAIGTLVRQEMIPDILAYEYPNG